MPRQVPVRKGKLLISTGEVLDLRETTHINSWTSSDGSGYRRSGTSSSNTLKLALQETEGRERHIELGEELMVGVRTGNTVSAIWYIPEGKNEGPYLAASNHDTGERRFIRKDIAGKNAGCMWLFLVLGGLLLSTVGIGIIMLGVAIWLFIVEKKRQDEIYATIKSEMAQEEAIYNEAKGRSA